MTGSLKVKVLLQEPDLPREKVKHEPTKRLKPLSEYFDPEWEVLLVPFGGPIEGRDAYGEAFTPKTDIGLKYGDSVLATYYHGFGPDSPDSVQEYPAIIGELIYTRADERGHWFSVLLDESEPLAKRILEADPATVRASSGAAGHLVRYDPGGIIRTWWVAEGALFDTNSWRQPANDYAVIEAKTTKDTITEAKAEVGETKSIAVESAEEVTTQTIKSAIPLEEIMDQQENKTPVVDIEEFEALKALQIQQSETIEALKAELPGQRKSVEVTADHDAEKGAIKGFLNYIKTGDMSAVKASNPVDMAEGAVATGGAAVPTGFYNKIIARRSESMLADKLGVTRIPGKGLTVQVPVDNEDDGEFVSTAEAAAWDKDTPSLNRVDMTLVKYTKDIPMSIELLRDEDANLEDFLADWIGRGMAKTHNNLLVTEVTTNGTNLNAAIGTPTAYTGGFAEKMAFAIPDYLEPGSTGWITSGPNYGLIAGLTGNARLYNTDPQGNSAVPQLMGYPVYFSSKVAAVAASAKSILFGNFRFVGLREGHQLTILRDPYSLASKGQVVLHVHFDAVYKVLQAKAVGYGAHSAT